MESKKRRRGGQINCTYPNYYRRKSTIIERQCLSSQKQCLFILIILILVVTLCIISLRIDNNYTHISPYDRHIIDIKSKILPKNDIISNKIIVDNKFRRLRHTFNKSM